MRGWERAALSRAGSCGYHPRVLLLEIAAQGVKGVLPAGGSARLRPGYNVVACDGAALRRLLEALYSPGPRDAEALRAGAGGTVAMRAGLTLAGDDGVTYRLVRDFAAGAQLHRFDPQKRAFALVSQDAAEIARHLQQPIGIPGSARRALLALSAAELPSRRGVGAAPAAPVPPRRALSAAEAPRRAAELRAELDRARKAEKLQYSLDGLQSRLFKLEEALKDGARVREAEEAANAALAALAPAAAVADELGDVDAKLSAHRKALAKRDEALAKIDAERTVLDEADGRGPPLPFWRDASFWAGVGGGAAALAIALAAGTAMGLRYVALLDIPAFGWAAWVALGWVSALEGHGRLGRRRNIVEDHERKVLEGFDRESADVRAALKALGVAGIPELQEALNRLSDARSAAAGARERREELEARPGTRSAQEEKARVEAELRDAEAGLAAETGGYLRAPRSVEAELQRLESEAASPEPEPVPAPPEPALPAADPLRELMQAAAKELGGSPAAAVRSLQAKASQVIQALSGNRITSLGVDDRGNLLVQAGGRSSSAGSLAPADRDLAFLALKLAVIERALAAGKVVALADDAFAGLPEGARRLAGRILKQLAHPGQLVHATSDVAFRESADHVVS